MKKRIKKYHYEFKKAVVVFKIIKPLLDQICEKHEKKLRIASLVGTLILALIQFLGMKGVFHVL